MQTSLHFLYKSVKLMEKINNSFLFREFSDDRKGQQKNLP